MAQVCADQPVRCHLGVRPGGFSHRAYCATIAAVGRVGISGRGAEPMLAPTESKRRFQLVLIKPSHYDDDGYVIQWLRSSIPSNSLACLYALAHDAARRQALGAAVEIDITAVDETNTRVRLKDIVAKFREHDGFGLVGLVG